MEPFLVKAQQQSSDTGIQPQAAIVMLSNFGATDGGRETWAFNFIPRLLDQHRDLRLSIFGLRLEGEDDNGSTVADAIPRSSRDRVSVDFVRAKSGRLPNAIAFWRGLPRIAEKRPAPAFVLAVGSWVELLAVLLAPRFRYSGKLVWLRSIFADEKAHRYPAFLRPLLEKIELAVLKRADVIIANGQDTADHYRKLGLTVSVIPNAVDLDRWRIPTARIGNPIDVLFVGRLTAVKGIDDFVAVARMASERHIEGLRFHVVGGPPVPIVEKAQMDGCLLYEGGVPNAGMPRVLSRSDACVALTYVRTGTDRFSGGAGVSNALLEQMAAGRLIIAWDNVAFRQVLDEDSAFLVPQGDREAILDALIKIRASPEIAERRAVRAAKVAEQYSFDRHLALFVQAAAKWMPARLGGAKLAPAEDV